MVIPHPVTLGRHGKFRPWKPIPPSGLKALGRNYLCPPAEGVWYYYIPTNIRTVFTGRENPIPPWRIRSNITTSEILAVNTF